MPATVSNIAAATGGIAPVASFVEADVDSQLFKFNSDDTPLMNLMLRAKRVKVASPEVDHYMIDSPKSTLTVASRVQAGKTQCTLPYVGVFMAGAGKYIDSERKRLEKEGDSYKALLIQALSDRLAEATSEYLHYLTRTEYWGYSADESLDIDKIMRGEYQGIRPAMGYPVLPDQLLNREIFSLLEPESGKRVEITENGAMWPTATVSGLYISNPQARYFMIGKIGDDQLDDYANRRGISKDRIAEILSI